jgi:antitoxin VapB
MLNERQASLFRNGRNQAVRIPREFELEGTEVLIRRDGESLVITPIRKSGLLSVLARMEPLDEPLPEIEDLPVPPIDAL